MKKAAQKRGVMTQEHPSEARIQRTGQDKCWDSRGHEIVSPQGTGQDGELQKGMKPPDRRFTDNDDGTVTDNLTGLIWLKNADLFGELKWVDAIERARKLADGSHGLSDDSAPGDWRVPNIRELLSIIDYGRSEPIIPAKHPFENVKIALYWTSTSLLPAAHLGWMMTLGIGPTVFDVKDSLNRSWPVRGTSSLVPRSGQKICFNSNGVPIDCPCTEQDGALQAGVDFPNPRFTDNGDGTVTDNMTQLVWLKNGNLFGLRVWEEALALCNSLSSETADLTDNSKPGDWRLPNIREIESLVDYNEVGPCLPKSHPFQNVRPSSYWTSTSVAAAPTEAMFIIFGVGPSIFESKEHPFFAWPVRNKLSSTK
ncbi:MAG: DUF1566 domain-containing protein [Candidatus Angelobacter sp.]